ncbi:MAG: glycosyltransferase family 9 protein [Opitutales bacterium]
MKYWVKVLQILSKKYPKLSFSILGTETEKEICTDIHSQVSNLSCENLSGKTNLDDLCKRLYDSKLLICNDSGAMHLANALGVPIVVIFGPTDPSVTGPIFDSPFAIIRGDFGQMTEGFEAEIFIQEVVKFLE